MKAGLLRLRVEVAEVVYSVVVVVVVKVKVLVVVDYKVNYQDLDHSLVFVGGVGSTGCCCNSWILLEIHLRFASIGCWLSQFDSNLSD